MPNKLAQEKSPYLLQHQHNPVDWLPWGEAAFERARLENKPIFLSIGYSTCHWCHVMERESFEIESVAQIMNEHFINIKVDREERPDVDRVYMTFVQATTGSGGWPMSVFLTPELKPFYGGTYFPPDDRYGRPGFSSLLKQLANAWENDRDNIETSAQSTAQALQSYSSLESSTRNDTDWRQIADKCYRQINGSFDSRYGGFGSAPKFPRPVTHDFLHAYSHVSGEKRALSSSFFTLGAMCDGGMNDQLGGGFHRYSVDEQWIVSHFEKMLYDQAQLVISFLEAHQLNGEEYFAVAARNTLEYVLRDLKHARGGFFAGEDADSFAPDTVAQDANAQNVAEQSEQEHGAHKEEGAFYVWTQGEIESALGDDAALFCAFYGVRPEGNAPQSGDPHGEFRGKNILFRARPLDEVAQLLGGSTDDAYRVLERGATTLFDIRARRPRPHRDDKIIAAWNGLMISAFARAAQVLNEPRYEEAAKDALSFVFEELWADQAGKLRRHFKDGAAEVWAFADDYAFLSRACVDMYETDFDVAHLRRAEQLIETLNRDFWDEEGGGYFASSPDANLLLRMKDDYDGAEPSANSIACRALLSLANLLDHDDLREKAEQTLNAFASRVSQIPQAMPELLCAALQSQTTPQHVVIVGDKNSDDTRELLQTVRIEYSMARSVIVRDENDVHSTAYWNERAPWSKEMAQRDNRATAYVCRDFACQNPTTSAQELQEQLKR
ncbi:MAG TPA: thioredoxin domain-containing protein [Abditibacteriaceae bacterium]|nr:thioredoxin domain-containing protein [Abditibacteriaceae bacterium]